MIKKVQDNINTVIYHDNSAVRWLLACFSAGGHVLLEDVPGTGKTTLAKALAKSVAAGFKRIQFTPDLLPSDILGVSIYHQQQQNFRFREGPIFTNILLADEINRASPRTQSALLEAMSESQVSIEGETRPLPPPFFVIATQNPVEFRGTYPLPEAQMDRFMISVGLGYVSAEQEIAMLTSQKSAHPLESIKACVTLDEVVTMQQQVRDIFVSEQVKKYIVDIVRATRESNSISLGGSPRASLALMRMGQALALMDGIDFVTPDLVQEAAVPVLNHRLSLESSAKYSGTTTMNVIEEVLSQINIPK